MLPGKVRAPAAPLLHCSILKLLGVRGSLGVGWGGFLRLELRGSPRRCFRSTSKVSNLRYTGGPSRFFHSNLGKGVWRRQLERSRQTACYVHQRCRSWENPQQPRFTRESSAGIISVVTGDESAVEGHVVNHREMSATSSTPM